MKLTISSDKTKIILKESTHEEYHQLKLHLIRKVENYHFKKRRKMGLWDGTIDHFHKGIMRFGLWKEIYRCCKDHGYKFDVDKKQFPFDLNITREQVDSFIDDFYKDYRVEPNEKNPDGIFLPYEHQREAIHKLLKFKQGLIEVATAGGKSLILGTFMFYVLKHINPNAKTLLIVPRASLVTQFYDDLIDYNEGYNKEQQEPFYLKIEELFSDKPRKVRDGEVPNIYIGTYQSLVTYTPDFFKQFDIVVVDECLHPDTSIQMADNTIKKISDVKKGDLVWTFNTDKYSKEVKEVDYVYHNLSKNEEMYEIELENGENIFITGNHKVRLTTNEWRRVDELTLEDEIVDFDI